MKSLAGRKVSELRIHQTTMIQGFGNLKNTITTSTKTQNDTEMLVVEDGVLVQAKASRTKVVGELFIPFGNIISAQLLPEAAEVQSDNKNGFFASKAK